MVGEKVEGWVALEGGVLASVWAEFGEMRQPVVRVISEWVGVGFGPDFRRSQAKCWAVSLWEGSEELQVAWVRLGSEF